MYKFNDKQRQRLLEDALVADLLRPAPAAQPRVHRKAVQPAAAPAAHAPGKAAA
jgi:hypothetical protein